MALCLQINNLRPVIEHSIDSLGICLTDWNMTMVTFSIPYPFTGGTGHLYVCDTSTKAREGPRPGGFGFPQFLRFLARLVTRF
jgi:hypothetical protein